MAPRIQNAVHHLDRSQLQFTFLPFEHAQGYISCKGSYGDPAPIDILSTGSHSLAGLFWIRWDMHSLNWIHRISSAQTDAADVISQRLPTPNDAWLPIIHVKHYTLVFVVDKNNGKVQSDGFGIGETLTRVVVRFSSDTRSGVWECICKIRPGIKVSSYG